jgi:hypothetical protein
MKRKRSLGEWIRSRLGIKVSLIVKFCSRHMNYGLNSKLSQYHDVLIFHFGLRGIIEGQVI